MSRENVELVRRLQPRPDADLVAVFRDEADTTLARLFATFFHSGCECVLHMPGAGPARYTGLSGWQAGWRDWLAPWASYRSEIEDVVDVGEDVVVLVRDYARHEQGGPEVVQIAAAVWTVRDGRISCVEFHAERDEALKAVGLKQ